MNGRPTLEELRARAEAAWVAAEACRQEAGRAVAQTYQLLRQSHELLAGWQELLAGASHPERRNP